MNYYGTRGGHDLVFHTELRDALFASGLPFVLSVNDVPEARELYSGADSITSLCSGKNSSKPELLVVRRGNPVASTGMGGAGRVSGEKKHSVSDTARTALLTDLRRWPGDGFFGMKPNSGSDALPIASLPQDFSGKIGS